MLLMLIHHSFYSKFKVFCYMFFIQDDSLVCFAILNGDVNIAVSTKIMFPNLI